MPYILVPLPPETDLFPLKQSVHHSCNYVALIQLCRH